MAVKEILFGKEGRDRILKGINVLADSVGSTMGYGGKTVMIHKGDFGGVVATKDGVRVASEIMLLNRFEDMGAKAVYQAAKATADIAGDGTTTSTVLSQYLINEGFKIIEKRPYNLTEFKNGMSYATDLILDWLDESAIKVEDDRERLTQIATVSANGDENLGSLVAEAITSVKTKNVIIDKEIANKDHYTKESGFNFESGLYSNHFESKQGTSICEYNNAKILIINDMLPDLHLIKEVITECKQKDEPLIIFAENISNNALTALAKNNVSGSLKIAALHLPDAGDLRKYSIGDLAIATGTRVVDRELGVKLTDITYEDLGTIDYIKSDMISTSIVFNEEFSEAINELHASLEEALETAIDADDKIRQMYLEKRVKRFSEGLVRIHIHASTEVEFEEKYDRLEDAVKAVLSAMEEGVIDGGGLGLYRAALSRPYDFEGRTESFFTGARLVLEACTHPINRILDNAGIPISEKESILKQIADSEYKLGYDVKDMEICNMLDKGVIDPIKVSKNALKNAVSVSSTLITTNTFIVNHDFKE